MGTTVKTMHNPEADMGTGFDRISTSVRSCRLRSPEAVTAGMPITLEEYRRQQAGVRGEAVSAMDELLAAQGR